MPSSEYQSSSSGALKFKGGGGSSSGGVTKKKKKRPPPPAPTNAEASDARQAESDSAKHGKVDEDEDELETRRAHDELQKHKASGAVKTEAEIRFEEKRRKRMEERLKKEGSKTHKERVEDLNRYLSKLSEHHDMPRIGPG